MKTLATNILDFCGDLAPYAYVLAVVAALVVGICLAVPSKKAHEFATSYGPAAIIGTILVAGCVTLGKWIGNSWSF